MKEDSSLSNEAAHLIKLFEDLAQRVERVVSTIEKPSQSAPSAPYNKIVEQVEPSGRSIREARPPLPDPRMVGRIIKNRQLRSRFFDAQLFADPAWDMLLDLTAATALNRRVSVTSLCIASGVPPTTALRWIGILVEQGLFERVSDTSDRRRAFVQLSDRGTSAMARYFTETGTGTHR
jgi:hypothetical protein